MAIPNEALHRSPRSWTALPAPALALALALVGCGEPRQGSYRAPLAAMRVNGTQLDTAERAAVGYVASKVIAPLSRYYGSRAKALDEASVVTWWALKEGVLDVKHPVGFSRCDPGGVKDRFAVCSGRAWQVGMAAVQAARPTSSTSAQSALSSYGKLAAKCFPGRTSNALLADTAVDAGYAVGSSAHRRVVGSTGYLRASWLLRVGCVGFSRQAPIVRRECVSSTRTWCYGTGWLQTRQFAPSKSGALRAISDLRAILAAATRKPTPDSGTAGSTPDAERSAADAGSGGSHDGGAGRGSSDARPATGNGWRGAEAGAPSAPGLAGGRAPRAPELIGGCAVGPQKPGSASGTWLLALLCAALWRRRRLRRVRR